MVYLPGMMKVTLGASIEYWLWHEFVFKKSSNIRLSDFKFVI